MSYFVPKEIPNCCGRCPCFHAEHPMYCQAVKADKNKRIYAPYGEGRPDWCPLIEIPNSSDTISRQAAIEALMNALNDVGVLDAEDINTVFQMLPPAQPEPSQVARDIARIVENEQDMRVIQQEIIYCKDCKKQNRHYHESPYKDTVCPLTAWRGTAQGHEYDYQFCCFAERREVTE